MFKHRLYTSGQSQRFGGWSVHSDLRRTSSALSRWSLWSERHVHSRVGVGVPVVTTAGPLTESLIGGAVAIAEHKPHQLRRAIESLLADKAAARNLGAASRRLYEDHFDLPTTVATLTEGRVDHDRGARDGALGLDAHHRTGRFPDDRICAAAQPAQPLLHHTASDDDQIRLMSQSRFAHHPANAPSFQTNIQFGSGFRLHLGDLLARDVEQKIVHARIAFLGDGSVGALDRVNQAKLERLLSGKLCNPAEHAQILGIGVQRAQHALPAVGRVSSSAHRREHRSIPDNARRAEL